MGKKTPTVAGRAWRLLRLPLLWTKKGFDLKPRSVHDSRLLKLESYPSRCSEREFSFDDTPSNQFKSHHRSASLCLLPCLTPSVDFEGEDEDEFFERKYVAVEDSDELDPGRDMVEAEEDWDSQSCWSEEATEKGEGEEEEIDSRAEKFITEFYQQIKLQPRFSPFAGRHGNNTR